ncbi:MAG: UDP-3-O-acyl-N-acetylglucosamine deacetylase [Candidatus Margulisiibacteriota bacterium]
MPHHHQTIKNAASLTGIGVHSGLQVKLRIIPNPTPGIQFCRIDLGRAVVDLCPSTVVQAERQTVLKNGDAIVMTPEHFLAACAGLGLTALTVELDGPELPILDGSAAPFVHVLKVCGIQVLPHTIAPLQLNTPILLRDGTAHIAAFPNSTYRLTHIAYYTEPYVGTQAFSIDLADPGAFEHEIAPARTHGRLADLKPLQQKGLAKGASYENTLALGKAGYLNPPRFANEIARHKTLDMIGDLAMLNRPLRAHIVGYQNGHALNQALVAALAAKAVSEP